MDGSIENKTRISTYSTTPGSFLIEIHDNVTSDYSNLLSQRFTWKLVPSTIYGLTNHTLSIFPDIHQFCGGSGLFSGVLVLVLECGVEQRSMHHQDMTDAGDLR